MLKKYKVTGQAVIQVETIVEADVDEGDDPIEIAAQKVNMLTANSTYFESSYGIPHSKGSLDQIDEIQYYEAKPID